jgi:hypothetical protein
VALEYLNGLLSFALLSVSQYEYMGVNGKILSNLMERGKRNPPFLHYGTSKALENPASKWTSF